MLEEVRTRAGNRRVVRLAKNPEFDLLTELGFDAQAEAELRKTLAAVSSASTAEELCDAPFRPKRRFRRRTRYSDGTFPVFYSSLDMGTAEAEIMHRLPVVMGRPNTARTAYYRRLECKFSGYEKDLRRKVAEWPDLVHTSDYAFCNQLGVEARELGLDGLVVPSARHPGANLPIFRREAISDAELGEAVAVTYDPNSQGGLLGDALD